MNYVDIAIIAIIAFFALIGLWKGFGKTLIKIICFAAALLVTGLIARYVVNALLGAEFVRSLVSGSGKISLYSLYYNSFGENVLSVGAGSKLDGALGLFINPMIDRFTALGGPEAYNITYAQFIAINLAINTLAVVLSIILYIVVRLVFALVAWLLKKIFLHGQVRAWSRFVGFLFGAVRGAAVVMVLLIASTVIYPFGFAANYTDTAGSGIIGKFACEYTYKAYDAIVYGGADNTEKTEALLSAAGINKVTLEEIRTEAINSLTAYRTEKEAAAEYTEAGKTNLDVCVENGKAAINAANNRDEVNSALEAAKKNIDAVYNKAQEEELAAAKTEKKAALEQLKKDKIGEADKWTVASAYSEDNFNQIVALGNAGYIEIDKATTVEQVNSIYDSYAAKINAVLTVNQENALANKKAACVTELNEFADNAIKVNALDAANIEKVNAAKTAATDAINAAASEDGVQTELDKAKAAINAIIDAAKTPEAGGENTGA